MKNNKRIRRVSFKKIKNGYWQSILVSFIMLIIISGGYRYNTVIYKPINNLRDNYIIKKNVFIIGDVFEKLRLVSDKPFQYHPTKGVLSIIFNQSIGKGSIIAGVISTVLLYSKIQKLPNILMEALGILLFILMYVFINNVMIVGKNRYYIEKHKYKKSFVDKLFFPYRVKSTLNVAYTMFLKDLYNFLWCFTIVGGVYKYYSYFMIPYLLAENPKMSTKLAFETSTEMMQGNKLRLFKLQISLLPYTILGILTFNISNIFFFNIYKEMVYSEFYFDIRNKLLKDESYRISFKDELLDGKYISGSYPYKDYFIHESSRRKWLKLDYNKKYSVSSIILFFFSCAFIGFIWEVFLNFVVGGFYVKKGAMHGPWIPIYGYGAIAIIVLLNRFKNKPWRLFILSILLCGVIEYFTGWYLETVNHMKWWDYTGYFLNINGRVCLEGLLVFGLAGIVFVYFLAPFLENIFSKMNRTFKKGLAFVLVILYLVDLAISIIYPNYAAGISLFINFVKF